MNTFLWIILGLVVVILVCLLPRFIKFINLKLHQRRLLKKDIPNSYFGINFGETLESFKKMFNYEKVTDENRKLYSYYPLDKDKNKEEAYVVKKISYKNVKFSGIYWDYVIFIFKNNVFSDIYFYHDDRYIVQARIEGYRTQEYEDIFDALVIEYDLIKYPGFHGLHARGVYKNNRKVYLNYSTSNSVEISNGFQNEYIYDIPGLTISFHDSEI